MRTEKATSRVLHLGVDLAGEEVALGELLQALGAASLAFAPAREPLLRISLASARGDPLPTLA